MAENQSTVENAKEKLDRWLKDGITTPGGKLPSERELGELLGIKRMTLRQALLNLEAESKIFRKDRKGWFVTQPRFNYSPELSASFQRAAIEQMQEMFGEATNPTIAQGRVPLVLELLSPAQRPLQITRDLSDFWKGAYREVQKEMKGRYPKHVWPDDPANTAPTRRTKKYS